MYRRRGRDQGSAPSVGSLLGRPTRYASAVAAVLFIALAVGGASRVNPVQTAVVEVAALLLLPYALWRMHRRNTWANARSGLFLCAVIAAIPILQLIPLPREWIASLPGQDVAAQTLAAAGLTSSWATVSLTPDATMRSGLALLVPISIFLATVPLSSKERRLVAAVVLGAAMLGLALGLAQIAGGLESPAYLYPSAHRGFLLGFFSNRNHEASLLLCSLPLVGALIASASRDGRYSRLAIIFGVSTLFAVVVALGVVRSRAGVILVLPVALASLAIVWRSAQRNARRATMIIAGIVLSAVVLVATLGLSQIIARFQTDVASDLRFAAAPDIWRLALDHLPLGSGLGSFDPLYRSVERIDLITPAFMNHAHNEYLELILEAGILAPIILAGFLLWYAVTAFAAWRGQSQRSSLAKAGAIIVGVFLIHSLVDYPLRTLALLAVFGFACALLTPARDERDDTVEEFVASETGADKTRVRKRVRI